MRRRLTRAACSSDAAPSRLPHCTRPTPSRARSRERGPAADAVASAARKEVPRPVKIHRPRPPPAAPLASDPQGAVCKTIPRALSCSQRPWDRPWDHVDGTPRLRAGKLVLLLLSPPISRPGDTTRGALERQTTSLFQRVHVLDRLHIGTAEQYSSTQPCLDTTSPSSWSMRSV